MFLLGLFFFLKELTVLHFVAGQTINGNRECADIYPENWHGLYIGNRNTTVTGKPCKEWRISNNPSFGIGNYCRSSSLDPLQSGPWCYINEPPWWEFCFVPRCNIDCLPSARDKGYAGTLNITHSGYTCHMWSDRSQLPSGGILPNYNDELMNFCRTPARDSALTPWCYTSSRTIRWENCDVPLCETITTSVCPDLEGKPHMIQPKRLTGYRYGEIVTFHCEAGYTLNMNITLKCLAQSQKSIFGKWNSSQPECISTFVCDRLSVKEGVVVNGLKPTIHFNEPVTLSCKEGFYGTSIQITCYHDGTWPVQRPTCTPKTCKMLTVDDQVMKSENISKYNDNVTLSCKEGYNGAYMILKCYANGSWPPQRPNCTAVPCPTLNETEHMEQSIKMSGYHFGNNITFQCVVGYSLSGPPFITCRSSTNKSMGHWSDQQPSCLAVPCPPLNETEHMDPSIKKTGYHFGNNITFQCVGGYRVSGPPFITCRGSRNKSMGHWSDQQPSCLALLCPSPKLPMHALNKDMIESKIYHVDQNVDFKCEKGYNLIGNGSFKCTVKSNSSVVDWNYEDDQACVEKSKSCKDSTEKRCSCMSYGLFGGTLTVFVAISAGVHIATCFYFRKREGKSTTVYEDMQFKTVERQNGSNDETYTELT